jgi:DNA-binding PadR family transcriptional regulator
MELSPTAYVVLGMLRNEPRSGYEIKQVVDHSTRFFWAASYGQIYPELRRLAKAGLVEGKAEPRGGRKRTVYRLTPAGRRELKRWLSEPAETFEQRDEGLLKLFFAGASPKAAAQALEAKRRFHEAKLAELRRIEQVVQAAAATDPFPKLVLRHGIECSQWMVNWCERAARELATPADRKAA